MSKTVKLALGAAVVAAVYVGSSWYVGGRIHDEVQKQATAAQTFLDTNSSVALFTKKRKVAISQYERGVFSSTVQYEIELADQEADFSFKFEDKIYHGPLPIVAGYFKPVLALVEGRLLQTEQSKPWFDAAQKQEPYQGRTVFEFGGDISGQGQFAALNYLDPETQMQLQTDLAAVEYSYERKTETVQVDIHAPKLSIKEDGQLELSLNQLDLQVISNNKSEQEHYQSRMSIAAVVLNSMETGALELKALQAQTDYKNHNDLTDVVAAYEVQEMWVEGVDWGRLDFDVDLKNIHQNSLNELGVLVDSDEPEDELKVRRLFGEFLSYKPEVKVAQLVWTNESGSSSISTSMSAAPTLVEYFQNDMELSDTLSQIYNTLNLDVTLSRPMLKKAMGNDGLMAAMFDMMFEGAVEAGTEVGLVTYDGSQVSLKFQFDAEQKTLLLNNKAITEEELLQLLLMLQVNGLL